MDRSQFSMFLVIAIFILLNDVYLLCAQGEEVDACFKNYYQVTWGNDHVSSFKQGAEVVQLSLDTYTGSGFASKLSYGSGFFNMSIKLPANLYTAGLVVAFFLTSNTSYYNNNHDELDFEFLGHSKNKPYVLQTNVFADGQGNKEERMSLWFDPTADFHSYQILWNQHQIVFYIDDIPIRVFKNNTRHGVHFPTQPMQIMASLWNGDAWATDQGRSKMDYSYGPFKAQFKGFKINGCPAQDKPTNISDCYSSQYWWNGPKYRQLSPAAKNAYENVRKKYVTYDYCNDEGRHPNGAPLECNHNASVQKNSIPSVPK